MTDRPGMDLDRRTFLRRASALGAVGIGSGGISSLLAACGSSAPNAASGTASPGKPAPGGRAVIATVDKPVNLDAADGQLYSSIQVYQNIYASLLYMNERFGYDPGLAASWTQDDERTWTLELVDNAVWHNGEPFTAADVAFTFERF